MPEARRDRVLARSRDVIREGSKSFATAARLFDPRTREAAYLLYAWCRHCDDQIDGEVLGRPSPVEREGRRARLDRLRTDTARVLRGEALEDPAFAALQRVLRSHDVPGGYALELLDGFAMDVEGRRYAELPDLLLYCYHVAGVVGLMMAHVMGVRDPCTLERAADLGIALQLTNIARDVVDDARAGRVYLPLAWLEDTGLAPEDVGAPRHGAAVAALVGRLLDEAERYYASGDRGLGRLPLRSAWAVTVARGVYAEIGRLVRARGARAWDRRAVVPRRRKVYWVARGLVEACGLLAWGRLREPAPRVGLWTKQVPSLE